MNAFKDKLTKTTRARKEELKQGLIEVENNENANYLFIENSIAFFFASFNLFVRRLL